MDEENENNEIMEILEEREAEKQAKKERDRLLLADLEKEMNERLFSLAQLLFTCSAPFLVMLNISLLLFSSLDNPYTFYIYVKIITFISFATLMIVLRMKNSQSNTENFKMSIMSQENWEEYKKIADDFEECRRRRIFFIYLNFFFLILYNPFISIHLNKFLWNKINIATIIILLFNLCNLFFPCIRNTHLVKNSLQKIKDWLHVFAIWSFYSVIFFLPIYHFFKTFNELIISIFILIIGLIVFTILKEHLESFSGAEITSILLLFVSIAIFLLISIIPLLTIFYVFIMLLGTHGG